ncbi:Conserved_hypothetical protein [Hexamita inflata]|uniref:Uncharacterized protein n=1 Tax=Hexamita inflata TaxID=28002 RepID=A0AA86RF38_9EUKA|nr:Conserved hypothetical protein [Hexamita inflata]
MSDVKRNQKRNYYKPQTQQELRFIDNLQGLFITSGIQDPHSIARCAYFLLRRYTQALPEQLKTTTQVNEPLLTDSCAPGDAAEIQMNQFNLLDEEEPVQNQIQQQTNNQEQKPDQVQTQKLKFNKLLPGARGCLFIQIPKTDVTIQEIYNDLLEQKEAGANFEHVSNFWPVDFTCKSEYEDFSRHFNKFLKEKDILKEDLKFEVKVRNNGGVKDETVEEWIKKEGCSGEGDRTMFINVCKCNLMAGVE